MGYAGKLELQDKARRLREAGFSIQTIENKLRVSRSSASIWVRDVPLTKKQIERLYLNKKTGGLKGSFIASENKKRATKESIRKFTEKGIKDVGKLLKRDRFIAGIALYFAEGTKSGRSNVSFSNSDPQSVVFMMSWLREFCNVQESKFRCSIYLHDNLNENKAKRFWAKITHIPLAQFRKTYIVENRKNRLRRTKHEYGVCRITVSNTILHRRIMGWIAGLFQNIDIPR
ncbi:MAG: hypothetical protein KJI69_00150 [Patescibacteria group bacterium]|nr:hypothetical protein [Patescibacteria group bacterium]